MDIVLQQYIETALWSSTDESDESGGAPMDDNYSVLDIHESAIAEMDLDVSDFMECIDKECPDWVDFYDEGDIGHNFWLTRNGQGTGFWDRGNGDIDDKLTELCRPYGEQYLYVGDDGWIYLQ
jgi:hypothetical protein